MMMTRMSIQTMSIIDEMRAEGYSLKEIAKSINTNEENLRSILFALSGEKTKSNKPSSINADLPDIDYLRSILIYYNLSGLLVSTGKKRQCGYRIHKGKICGLVKDQDSKYEEYIKIDGLQYSKKRISWYLYYEEDLNDDDIYFINGNKLDCRIANLTDCNVDIW
tara:strand:- start:120 stop:614 length:495 start_codon:yes stop_codon:yes gene_type:complete